MARTDFGGIACSIARSAAIVGDPWALLVVRDVAVGLHRFDEIQRDLGVATNVLSDRLQRLVSAEVLRKDRYERHPDRFEYRLTDKGRDLMPALLALMAWGDRWESGAEGPPLLVRHKDCDHITQPVVVCDRCGEQLTTGSVDYRPGSGGRIAPGTALIANVLKR
ncbi:helix-turn-helix transcriptional regulator [Nocardia sp. NBC_01503]|uniref:winged helix-turn-helix transcriptional regulator n=1 Tax=Nocardia sp. NBC_01503 TaxID=2975997 RepID=UPI002E7B978D|nr:helix-turn-helix domain-containing protein [Nocardia sp. NBC_01503]WTL30852.1 helix-turn-helix transcriptional regulator [Nocardia sp. NBC_01503]